MYIFKRQFRIYEDDVNPGRFWVEGRVWYWPFWRLWNPYQFYSIENAYGYISKQMEAYAPRPKRKYRYVTEDPSGTRIFS